jgi:hypothetical protein
MPEGVISSDPGLAVSPAGGHHIGRRRTAALLARYIFDEGLVVMAKDRQNLCLQRPADVRRFQGSQRSFSLKQRFTSVSTDRAPLPPQAAVSPKGMQLLGGIRHASPLVGDLRVGSDHHSIFTYGGKHDSHVAILPS